MKILDTGVGGGTMNQPLAQMLRYEKWATLTLLEACRVLSQEQLDARMPGISGSAGELLTHIVGGQQTFALRTQGRQSEGELNRSSAWPGIDALIELTARTGDQLIAVAESLDAEREVHLPYLGRTYRFPLSFFLVHAVEHGTEHRTEVKVALDQMGFKTPDLDGWQFATAMGYGREVASSDDTESR
jgi:uncharacterized damage-inducible protein DinB